MSKSEQDLREAFAGESQANRKYLAFAKKADEEGFHQVAKLFRAAGEAETIHAHNHLRALNGIKSTKENLEAVGIKDPLKDKIVSADTGYYSVKNLKTCKEYEVDAYVPDPKFRKRDVRFA